MADLARQTVICELRRAGNSPPNITKMTGYAMMTFYRVVAILMLRVKLKEAITAHERIEK